MCLLLRPRKAWRAVLEGRVWNAALGRVLIRVFPLGRPQGRTRLDSTRRGSAGCRGAGGVEGEHPRPG